MEKGRKIETDSAFGGKKAPTINIGLRNLMDLIGERAGRSQGNFDKILPSAFEETRTAIPGELVSSKVKGSVILGPKIGSFYGNLNGDFSSATMDRWFMRTFNRRGNQQLPLALKQIQTLTLSKAERYGPRFRSDTVRTERRACSLKKQTMEPE